MHSIEPFCTAIRRISRIFIPMAAVVRLGTFMHKRTADRETHMGGFKEIEKN
jgi:hypothetical protein